MGRSNNVNFPMLPSFMGGAAELTWLWIFFLLSPSEEGEALCNLFQLHKWGFIIKLIKLEHVPNQAIEKAWAMYSHHLFFVKIAK